MTDILERLRRARRTRQTSFALMDEAVKEIEGLRARFPVFTRPLAGGQSYVPVPGSVVVQAIGGFGTGGGASGYADGSAGCSNYGGGYQVRLSMKSW